MDKQNAVYLCDELETCDKEEYSDDTCENMDEPRILCCVKESSMKGWMLYAST
jgi:hypothetical protein